MKKYIITFIFLLLAVSFSFAQEHKDLSKRPIFVMKLADGTEKISRLPIAILNKQYKMMIQLNRDSFFRIHPDIKGTSVFAYPLSPSVKKILGLNDILNLFNIKNEYREYEVEVKGYPYIDVDVQKNIFAAENSIKSVIVDTEKKKIIINKFPDLPKDK